MTTKTVTTILVLLIAMSTFVFAVPELSAPDEILISFAQATASTGFTFTNTGDQTLTDVVLTTNSDFNLQVSTDGTNFVDTVTIPSVAVDGTITLTAQATVEEGKLTTSPIGSIIIKSKEETTDVITVRGTQPSKLVFKEVNVDVGGKNKEVSNGDVITNGDAGDRLEIDVELENTFEADVDIDNIDVQVTIKRIDDRDDLEEDETISSIRAGEKESVRFDFLIPVEADEGKYEIDIIARGRDDNNVRHEATMTFEIEIEKKTHDIRVHRATLSQELLACDRSTSLRTTIKNFGSKDEDQAALRVYSEALGIDKTKFDLDLQNDAFDEDSEYELSVSIDVDKDQPSGDYPIKVTAFRDDDRVEDEKSVTLTILDCIEVPEIPVRPAQPIVPAQVVVNNPPAPEPTNDIPLLWILGIVVIIGLILAIIMLSIYVVKKNRRY